MKIYGLLLLFSTTITAMDGNLKFNNVSPNPPSKTAKTQITDWYSYNSTHLTIRYASSPGQPLKSVIIAWTPEQRKLFLNTLKKSYFYPHVYVQGKNTKNSEWFVLPKNQDKKDL